MILLEVSLVYFIMTRNFLMVPVTCHWGFFPEENHVSLSFSFLFFSFSFLFFFFFFFDILEIMVRCKETQNNQKMK